MSKKLVAFFSASGTTKKVAQMIAEEVKADLFDYSGTLRATCPDFESHHSGEWEPYIPVIQSHLIGLYYIYFLYTVNTHLWCEYR